VQPYPQQADFGPPAWRYFAGVRVKPLPCGVTTGGVILLGVELVGVAVLPGAVLVPLAAAPGEEELDVLVTPPAAGALAAAVPVAGAVTAGTVVAAAGGAAVVTVCVIGTGAGPVSPASFTSAAAITPRTSASSTAAARIGALQFGAAASRVRAAAPQCRHHS
jgi:hypothetical protein